MFKKRLKKEYEDQIISQIEQRLPAFRSFAAGLCGDRFVADDLVQAACERALKRLDQVNNLSGVGSWVNRIIYTDIERDGLLSGVNYESTGQLASSSAMHVIASGGVASLEDVRAAAGQAPYGVDGVIIGRALYDGRIDLAHLEQELRTYADRPLRIGSFSAASNVTGIITDTAGMIPCVNNNRALFYPVTLDEFRDTHRPDHYICFLYNRRQINGP